MKKLGLIVVSLLISNFLFAQECKVLKPEIADSYQGECKNGLAQGKGVAKGKDSYEGEFRKGYPDGEGTYTWANGATYTGEWRKGVRAGKGKYVWHTAKGDSTLVGVWSRDKYDGTGLPSYNVERQQNITRYSIRKVLGNVDNITIRFIRAGSNYNQVSNLSVATDSGNDELKGQYLMINNATFPFEVKLNFSVPNLLNTSTNDCIFNFKITEKGSWEVQINV